MNFHFIQSAGCCIPLPEVPDGYVRIQVWVGSGGYLGADVDIDSLSKLLPTPTEEMTGNFLWEIDCLRFGIELASSIRPVYGGYETTSYVELPKGTVSRENAESIYHRLREWRITHK